jgi:hypothetical protein
MDKGFILYFIVSSQPENLENIFELLPVWGNKEDTSSYST